MAGMGNFFEVTRRSRGTSLLHKELWTSEIELYLLGPDFLRSDSNFTNTEVNIDYPLEE